MNTKLQKFKNVLQTLNIKLKEDFDKYYEYYFKRYVRVKKKEENFEEDDCNFWTQDVDTENEDFLKAEKYYATGYEFNTALWTRQETRKTLDTWAKKCFSENKLLFKDQLLLLQNADYCLQKILRNYARWYFAFYFLKSDHAKDLKSIIDTEINKSRSLHKQYLKLYSEIFQWSFDNYQTTSSAPHQKLFREYEKLQRELRTFNMLEETSEDAKRRYQKTLISAIPEKFFNIRNHLSALGLANTLQNKLDTTTSNRKVYAGIAVFGAYGAYKLLRQLHSSYKTVQAYRKYFKSLKVPLTTKLVWQTKGMSLQKFKTTFQFDEKTKTFRKPQVKNKQLFFITKV